MPHQLPTHIHDHHRKSAPARACSEVVDNGAIQEVHELGGWVVCVGGVGVPLKVAFVVTTRPTDLQSKQSARLK